MVNISIRLLLGNTALALAFTFFSSQKKFENDKIINQLIECRYCNLKTRNKEGNTLAHIICKSKEYPPEV